MAAERNVATSAACATARREGGTRGCSMLLIIRQWKVVFERPPYVSSRRWLLV